MSALLSNPKRLFNYIALFVVFLNFTNIYTILSGVLNIPFRYLSIGMMVILSLNVLVNLNIFLQVFKNKIFWFFLIVFCLIPAVGVVISPYTILRYFGYCILSGLLFVNACMFIYREGSHLFKKAILASFIIALTGLILSYYFPWFFAKAFALKAAAEGAYGVWDQVQLGASVHSRAFGFYLQPNVAYTAVLFQLIILITAYFNRNLMARCLLYISTLYVILLTGSRGGLIMFIVFLTTVVLSEIFGGYRNQLNIKKSFFGVAHYYILLAFCGLFIVFAYEFFLQDAKNSLMNRFFLTFFNSSNQFALDNDVSLFYRLNNQLEYIGLISKNPISLLVGFGTGASAWFRFTGEISGVSHNNFLEKTFSHGLIVSVSMYGMFLYLLKSKASKLFHKQYGYNISLIITICIFVQTFTINTLFSYRLFPVLVAFWLMALYFPNDRSQERLAPRP